MQTKKLAWVLAIAGVCGLARNGWGAEPPSVEITMKFKPQQGDVEYDIPAVADYPQCKVTAAPRIGKGSGWIVFGPAGQPLRRFMDANGDNTVDQWSYYKNGLEVYRDSDTNANGKVDQSRWLNFAGSRWGIDRNEDGRIDEWKMISAEEVSRQAVRALVAQDPSIIAPLLLTTQDINLLGIKGPLEDKLLESVSNPGAKLQKAIAGSKVITPRTVWMRFDSANPSAVPADQLKTTSDLLVYENVMAIVDSGTNTPGLVQIGEMVRIGDAWKLTGYPQPLEGNAPPISEGGLLMQPPVTAPAGQVASSETPGGGIAPEIQKLVEQLQELDKKVPQPNAGRAEVMDYNMKRAKLLEALSRTAKAEEDRLQWSRQLIDTITASVQVDAFANGVEWLKRLEQEIKLGKNKVMIPYIVYRRMVAELSVDSRAAAADKQPEVQKAWLKDLEGFVSLYPESDDAADAIQQLAVGNEFNGNIPKATEWYNKLVKGNFRNADAAKLADGALKRLNLDGKPLALSGKGLDGGVIDISQYKNKVVLVLFWATWCKPCEGDLPQIKELYKTYHDRGFEIVGINLDTIPQLIGPYMRENGVIWPQIFEPGGLESGPAKDFGIISLPTMFIVDKKGIVTNRSASVGDVKAALATEFAPAKAP